MSRQRVYKLTYPSGRPVFYEDAGQLLKITGLLMQGMDKSVLVIMPTASDISDLTHVTLTLEEWCQLLAITDDPKIFEEDKDYNVKAVHRKVERAISGAVQQEVWKRDGFQCMYCGKAMGDVQLTVDHFVPLERGGENNPANYLAACRQCQKSKGSRDPKEYCAANQLDYYGLTQYLEGKCSWTFITHLGP